MTDLDVTIPVLESTKFESLATWYPGSDIFLENHTQPLVCSYSGIPINLFQQ